MIFWGGNIVLQNKWVGGRDSRRQSTGRTGSAPRTTGGHSKSWTFIRKTNIFSTTRPSVCCRWQPKTSRNSVCCLSDDSIKYIYISNYCQNLLDFCKNISICRGNYLGFPTLPEKFREISEWRRKHGSSDFLFSSFLLFRKICKSAHVEFGAVQNLEFHVERRLEKSGAKIYKNMQWLSCRFWKMLQHEHQLAKISVGTADRERAIWNSQIWSSSENKQRAS